jgi:hypothetical protein
MNYEQIAMNNAPKANPSKPKQTQSDPHFSLVMAPQSQSKPKQTQSKANVSCQNTWRRKRNRPAGAGQPDEVECVNVSAISQERYWSRLRVGKGLGFHRWFPVAVPVWASASISISTCMWATMSAVPFPFGFFALEITAAFSTHSVHLLRPALEALLVLGYQLVQGLHRFRSAFPGGNGADGFETLNALVEGLLHHVCPWPASRRVGIARPTGIGLCQRACVGVSRLQSRPSAVSSAAPVALFLGHCDTHGRKDNPHNHSDNY